MNTIFNKKNGYYDLSQPIENGMTCFPGDPRPKINPQAGSEPWKVSELMLGTHTGTHIDSASHFIPKGKTIDQYPIGRFILPGLMVDSHPLSTCEPIWGEKLDEALSILPKGGGIIIRTGWDIYWRQEQYLEHPYLTEEAAERLVTAGVSLIGVDALNVDSTVNESSIVHDILLGNDVLIVENLANLNQLTPVRLYQFLFVPLRLKGLDGSPIRAIAWEV
jgi:arylformamidase